MNWLKSSIYDTCTIDMIDFEDKFCAGVWIINWN